MLLPSNEKMCLKCGSYPVYRPVYKWLQMCLIQLDFRATNICFIHLISTSREDADIFNFNMQDFLCCYQLFSMYKNNPLWCLMLQTGICNQVIFIYYFKQTLVCSAIVLQCTALCHSFSYLPSYLQNKV